MIIYRENRSAPPTINSTICHQVADCGVLVHQVLLCLLWQQGQGWAWIRAAAGTHVHKPSADSRFLSPGFVQRRPYPISAWRECRSSESVVVSLPSSKSHGCASLAHGVVADMQVHSGSQQAAACTVPMPAAIPLTSKHIGKPVATHVQASALHALLPLLGSFPTALYLTPCRNRLNAPCRRIAP